MCVGVYIYPSYIYVFMYEYTYTHMKICYGELGHAITEAKKSPHLLFAS